MWNKQLRIALSGIALFAMSICALSQSRDYHPGSGLGQPGVPLWQSFDDIFASEDALSLQTRVHFDEIVASEPASCLVPPEEIDGTEHIVDGVNARESLSSAARAASFIAHAEIVSITPGRFRDEQYGSILELRIIENLGKRPFPSGSGSLGTTTSAANNARTIFYFYPIWDYEYKGVPLCGRSPWVPAVTPSVGDQMVVFATRNDIGKSPWFFGSARLFPIIFESSEPEESKLHRTMWTDSRSRYARSLEEVVVELRDLKGGTK